MSPMARVGFKSAVVLTGSVQITKLTLSGVENHYHHFYMVVISGKKAPKPLSPAPDQN
jgi:hypothetical protein